MFVCMYVWIELFYFKFCSVWMSGCGWMRVVQPAGSVSWMIRHHYLQLQHRLLQLRGDHILKLPWLHLSPTTIITTTTLVIRTLVRTWLHSPVVALIVLLDPQGRRPVGQWATSCCMYKGVGGEVSVLTHTHTYSFHSPIFCKAIDSQFPLFYSRIRTEEECI